MAELPKSPRLMGNRGRGTRQWRKIVDRKWKYGSFAHAHDASGHNYYRNSSFIVDMAMGQIPRSTERIPSLEYNTVQLENVITVMHCNLRAPDAAAVLFRLKYETPMSIGFMSINLSVAVIAFSLLMPYVMLWPLPLAFHLEYFWCIGCDANYLPNFIKIDHSRSGVIAISVFDLMTLNMCHVLRSALRHVWGPSAYSFLTYNVLLLIH